MRSGLKTLLEPEPAAEDGDGAPSPLVYGAAGLTAAALAGGAALLMRRRVRRSLDEPPIPPAPKPKPAPGDDFAGAELARVLTHRLHGGEVEPAVVVAEQARRFLAEEAVDEAAVVFAYQGRNAVTLLLRASLAEQPRLLELATPFGTRLGSDAQATVTAERDVVWRLTGLKIAGLLTPGADRPADPLALLAVGVAPSRETVYANWRALGHVLVAGLPGGGTDVVLTTLVAALAARCRPDELRLSMIASRRTLPRQLVDLPHQCCDAIDPEDDAGVRAVLAGLRTELVRRMRAAEADGTPGWQPSPDQPELVLVVGELGALEVDGTTLELIGTHGPTHGVRLLAATTESGAFGDEVLPHFTTRLVLQTLDDDESIHLLGRPEAADLGSGELLLRVEGREPVRLRGFRVAAERLDELVRLTREAYGGRWRAAGGAAPALDESGAGAPPPDEEPPTSGDEELVEAEANGAHRAALPAPRGAGASAGGGAGGGDGGAAVGRQRALGRAAGAGGGHRAGGRLRPQAAHRGAAGARHRRGDGGDGAQGARPRAGALRLHGARSSRVRHSSLSWKTRSICWVSRWSVLR